MAPGARRALGPLAGLDALAADEVIALLPSLEPAALAALAEHEAARRACVDVLQAIAGLQGFRSTV